MKDKKKRNKIKYTLLIIVGLIVVTGLIHIVSMFTFDKWIEYKDVLFKSPKVSSELSGYRIAFITDTHAISMEDLEGVVDELNNREIDLLVLGGDFVPSSTSVDDVLSKISKIKTVDGIYGIEGNHDRKLKLFDDMERNSITPLINNGCSVSKGLYVAGVRDFWRYEADIVKSVEDAKEDEFVLLLTHNADVTMLQDTTGSDLILSGHSHGGQITLFGVFAPALSMKDDITKCGQRFMSGWAKSRDNVPVYVSNGTGSFASTPRVFARPQVIIFTLLSE